MSKINVPGIDKNILEIRLLLFTFRNNNKFMKTSNTIITPIKLFLSAFIVGKQGKEGRPGRLHAEIHHHTECDDP